MNTRTKTGTSCVGPRTTRYQMGRFAAGEAGRIPQRARSRRMRTHTLVIMPLYRWDVLAIPTVPPVLAVTPVSALVY